MSSKSTFVCSSNEKTMKWRLLIVTNMLLILAGHRRIDYDSDEGEQEPVKKKRIKSKRTVMCTSDDRSVASCLI
jgi:hypothetical protein